MPHETPVRLQSVHSQSTAAQIAICRYVTKFALTLAAVFQGLCQGWKCSQGREATSTRLGAFLSALSAAAAACAAETRAAADARSAASVSAAFSEAASADVAALRCPLLLMRARASSARICTGSFQYPPSLMAPDSLAAACTLRMSLCTSLKNCTACAPFCHSNKLICNGHNVVLSATFSTTDMLEKAPNSRTG